MHAISKSQLRIMAFNSHISPFSCVDGSGCRQVASCDLQPARLQSDALIMHQQYKSSLDNQPISRPTSEQHIDAPNQQHFPEYPQNASAQYQQHLAQLTNANYKKYSAYLTSLLHRYGIHYHPTFNAQPQMNLLQSIDSGNILKLRVHYGHYTHNITIYNTNQDNQLPITAHPTQSMPPTADPTQSMPLSSIPQNIGQGVSRVRSRMMVCSRVRVAVRYLYEPESFKLALSRIVGQYLISKIARVVQLKQLRAGLPICNLVVYNNEILLIEDSKVQQLSSQPTRHQTNTLIRCLLNLHLLHIVHTRINPTVLNLVGTSRSIAILDFHSACILQQNIFLNTQHPQMNSQHPQLNSQHPQLNSQHPQLNSQHPQLNSQHHEFSSKYLQDYTDLLHSIDNFKPPASLSQAGQVQTKGGKQAESVEGLTQVSDLMSFKFMVSFIFQWFFQFVGIIKQQPQKTQNRSLVKNQLIEFAGGLGKRKQMFCNSLFQYLQIHKSNYDTPIPPLSRTFNYEYSCLLFQLQTTQKRQANQFNTLLLPYGQHLTPTQTDNLFAELSKYLVFTSNQFSMEERELKIGLIMETLQVRDYSLHFITDALTATLRWTTGLPFTDAKLRIFQRIVLQCVIRQVEPQDKLLVRLDSMMGSPARGILKLKLVLQMLNAAAWINQKTNTNYHHNAITLHTLTLLRAQLANPDTAQLISPKTLTLLTHLQQYCSHKTSAGFVELARAIPYLSTSADAQLKCPQQIEVVWKVEQYIFGYLCSEIQQLDPTYSISRKLCTKLLSDLHFYKIEVKGYFQFDYYHFALNRLLISSQYFTDATAIFLCFSFLLADFLNIASYSIYLRHQVSNILYYNSRQIIEELVRPLVVNGSIISHRFYDLMLRGVQIKPFFDKLIQCYSKEKQLFTPTLSLQNISLFQSDGKDQDQYSRLTRFKNYLNYYFYFALPLFNPTTTPTTLATSPLQVQTIQQQQAEARLEAYLAKVESQISKVKNVSEKMKYYWLLAVQKIANLSKKQPIKQQAYQNTISFLIYSMKDAKAFYYISSPLKALLDPNRQELNQYMIVREYLKQVMNSNFKLNPIDLNYLKQLLDYLICHRDAAELADVFVEVSQYMYKSRLEEDSVIEICSIFGKQFAAFKKRAKNDQLATLTAETCQYIWLRRKAVKPILYFLFLSNLKPASKLYQAVCNRLANSFEMAWPKQKQIMLKQYYKLYLKQLELGVRKKRYVQKKGLKFDLKIDTTKKVAKKLLLNSNKKKDIIIRSGTFCSKLFVFLERYCQKLEILS